MRHPEHNDQWQKLTRQHRIAPPLAPAPTGVRIKTTTLRNLTSPMKPATDLSTKPMHSSNPSAASSRSTPPALTRPAMFLGSKATGELRILMRLAAGVSPDEAPPCSDAKASPHRSF
jgi:hypothetical protein